MSIELPHPPAAFDVVYEFPSPLGGVHRKLDSNRWNGNRPTTSQPVYSQDQLIAYGQHAARLALEEAANVCDEIYHNYACDESAGECVKAIRLLKDNT